MKPRPQRLQSSKGTAFLTWLLPKWETKEHNKQVTKPQLAREESRPGHVTHPSFNRKPYSRSSSNIQTKQSSISQAKRRPTALATKVSFPLVRFMRKNIDGSRSHTSCMWLRQSAQGRPPWDGTRGQRMLWWFRFITASSGLFGTGIVLLLAWTPTPCNLG